MKTKEQIIREKYYEYYRPDFPSDERALEAVEMGLILKEEKDAVFKAMEEYADQSWNEALELAANSAEIEFVTYADGYIVVEKPQIKRSSILKLKK